MNGALVHGACVAWDGRGLLILGAPGAGKSALALEMIALGAALVADDQVALAREGRSVTASPHPRLAGMIEARGVGLLRLPHRSLAAVALVLDLDAAEPERLPPRRTRLLLDAPVALMLRPAALSAAAVLAALRWWAPLDPEAPLDAS